MENERHVGAVLLRVEDVEYSYGDRRVLAGCSFTVGRSEVVAVMGPSGTGKTTLLKLLAGVISPSAGRVLVQDRPENFGGRKTSMVFQNYCLFPWRNARENVEYPLEILQIGKRVRREAACAALDRVGMLDAAFKYPHQLSGGMKQRVAVARSIVVEPSVLLLDEPMSSLDLVSRNSLRLEFADLLHRSRSAVVLVTHDITDAIAFANRVLFLAGEPAHIVEDFQLAPGTCERPLVALRQKWRSYYPTILPASFDDAGGVARKWGWREDLVDNH